MGYLLQGANTCLKGQSTPNDSDKPLNTMGYDLPHKIGSQDFGNTFGGSAAIGCGGVRVDNKSGAPATTQAGNLGVVGTTVGT